MHALEQWVFDMQILINVKHTRMALPVIAHWS